MHGVIQPVGADVRRVNSPLARLREKVHAYRWFLALVIAPTLLTSAYLWLIAADQYQSEAHFLVRTQATSVASTASGISQVISAVASENASPEANSVADYLTSHDVVATLRRQLGLVDLYRRPEADWLSKLKADPTDEKLLKFYLAHTSVQVNGDTGITVIHARAFRPQDAYAIASALLTLGDRRINSLNTHAYRDAVASQERQLRDAENELAQAQGAISNFRTTQHDIDPAGTGTAQTALVSALNQGQAQARAQLISVGQTLSHNSPQYVALARRVAALQGQINAQQGKLAGSGSAIAAHLADYNELQMRQQFASKRYEAVALALDRARQQTVDKQLYLVRVVNPNYPEKATFPERTRIVSTLFLSLLLAYGIGWLIVAGMREHAI